MRRFITMVACLAVFAQANATTKEEKDVVNTLNTKSEIKLPDWRDGHWRRNVPEHLISVNVNGAYTISDGYTTTNPFAVGATLAYQYKMRHWKVNSHFTTSFGGYSGVLYYRGASVERTAEGARHDISIDRYKSYTLVPFMLEANLHYDFNRTSIYLGVDAGANMMIGFKDFEQYGGVYIQKNFGEIKVSRFIPSAKAKLGFMQEIGPMLKLRFAAGIQYQMGYKDDFDGVYRNGGYYPEESVTDLEVKAQMDPFAEIGLVISL